MNNEHRPNILLITSDQQRKDSIGAYNPHVSTPVLDALAREGGLFDRAYITHPTCTPSRASLLTGQYASTHGAYTIGTALPENAVKVSDVLGSHGYETYFTGKPHFQQLGTDGSFEYEATAMHEQRWRDFEGPYYGFEHTRMFNGHTNYPLTAGMHYRVWLKDHGLSDADIDRYFNYVSNDPFRQHGEWKLPRELHPTVFVSEMSRMFLDQHKRDATDTPFFMWASMSDPHDPHVTPEPYASMYDPNEVEYRPYVDGEFDDKPECYRQLYELGPGGLPFADRIGVPSAPSAKLFGDDQYFREITAVHHGMVKLIDEEIGRIIDKLKEIGEYENTLIVFTTDHGDYLGNHGFVYKGFPAFEEVYNVPYLVKTPEDHPYHQRTSALVSHVDFAATALSFAGITAPEEMEGVDQKKVFLGNADSARDAAIIENRPVQHGFYQHMLVTDRYKIVVYMDSSDGELYKMADDPHQYKNLWNDSGYQEIKNNLCNRLMNRRDTEDSAETSPSTADCLASIHTSMHMEEPVQTRTSYS